MIYILSGVAKAGKTLLSNQILSRHHISVFSTDYIMMMLAKGNKGLNLDINASDSTVAKEIEPYVYGMIETMVENEAFYLIEGVHFNTEFSKKLLNQFEGKIKVLYVGYRNICVEDKLKEIYKYKEVMDNPWLFDHNGESVEDIIAYLIKESQRIYDECQSLSLPYVDIYDINDQIDDIIQSFIGNT